MCGVLTPALCGVGLVWSDQQQQPVEHKVPRPGKKKQSGTAPADKGSADSSQIIGPLSASASAGAVAGASSTPKRKKHARAPPRQPDQSSTPIASSGPASTPVG